MKERRNKKKRKRQELKDNFYNMMIENPKVTQRNVGSARQHKKIDPPSPVGPNHRDISAKENKTKELACKKKR